MNTSHKWISDSAETTQAVGTIIGEVIPAGMVIALCGDLGAGKTTITQGIAAGLGVVARVTSPTFIFMNEYPTAAGHTLIHVDSYRLGDSPELAALEAFTLGMDEILERKDAIVLIEWADLIESLLPEDHLQLTLKHISPEQSSSQQSSLQQPIYALASDTTNMRKIVGIAHGPISTNALEKVVAQVAI